MDFARSLFTKYPMTATTTTPTSPTDNAPSFAHDSRALAETYDRLSDTQFVSGKDLVHHLGRMAGGRRLLDVGCGTGRLARWVAEQTGSAESVVGLDPLPERIAVARAHGLGIRFEIGRAENLGAFASESFDAVCMSSVLHWVADKPKALAEARRVLRPGGRFGVTTLSRELSDAGSIAAVARDVIRRAPYAERVPETGMSLLRPGHMTTTELITAVLECGLELAELHIRRRLWTGANGNDAVDFLESSSFGNLLGVVPEDLRDRVRTDLAATYDAHKERGRIVAQTWTTVLVATRQ